MKIPYIAFTILITSTLLSGCIGTVQSLQSGYQAVNNVRSGYQASQAFSSAKSMAGDQGVFNGATTFSVSTTLMPHDQDKHQEIEQAFTQITLDEVLATSEKLNLNLTYCDTQCPQDAIKIQFVEKGREGFMERFAMGDKVGGSLYLSQNGAVVEELELDMAEDYAGMAQTIIIALNVRMARAAQASLAADYESGNLDDAELEARTQAIMNAANGTGGIQNPLLVTLKGKS